MQPRRTPETERTPVMLMLTGKVERVFTREAGNPGNTWTETVVVVQDWGSTEYVTLGKDFGDAPEEGTFVALAVQVRAYPTDKNRAGAGSQLIGVRRAADAEAALFGNGGLSAVGSRVAG